eukprot:6476680-Amphidinium_carterae.3
MQPSCGKMSASSSVLANGCVCTRWREMIQRLAKNVVGLQDSVVVARDGHSDCTQQTVQRDKMAEDIEAIRAQATSL